MSIVKVSAQSPSPAVAGAIAGMVRDHGIAEVQAIGAGAVNQAVKAIAIAHSFLIVEGTDIVCRPSFATVVVAGDDKTAIRFAIEPKGARPSPA